MGAWGAGIFQNDVSEELKSDYVKKLKMGKTDEEALSEIIDDYKDMTDDPDDEIDFWFALSLTMHKYGRLTDYVKEKALTIIESGKDFERFEDDKSELKKRIKNVEILKNTLNEPMPERKKVPLRKKIIAPFEPNEVYYMKLSDDFFKDSEFYNKYIIMIIESLVEEGLEIKEIIDIYPRTYRKLSDVEPKNLEDINAAEFIPSWKDIDNSTTYIHTYVAHSNLGFVKFKNRFSFLGVFDNYDRPADAADTNDFGDELMPISAFNYRNKFCYQTFIVKKR
jgi:hypothetical protein